MRPGGGKAKGAQFERDMCRELSLWLSNGTHEDLLWRSAMSGGRSTVAHAKGKRLAAQAGDISSIHPLGHMLVERFMIECKTYRDLQLVGLLGDKGNLAKFWAEAKIQAARYKKLPLLIGKQNQHPIIVCLTREGLRELFVQLKCSLTAPKLNLFVVLLDDFLKHAVRPHERRSNTGAKQ